MEEQKLTILTDAKAPSIGLNEVELRTWAQGIAAKYQGLVVTEDQVPAIRKDMAELNDLADKLDKARIATVREVSAPIKDFEEKVKGIRAIILDTRKALADQVAGYEETARQEKHVAVQAMVDQAKAARMVPDLSIPIQASWLTKSATKKAIAEAINDIINAHLAAVKLKEDLAMAKQERAMAVEAKVGELNQAHGLELTVSIFVDCLDTELPLVDAFERMEKHYSAKAAEAAKEAAEAQRREAESHQAQMSEVPPTMTKSHPEETAKLAAVTGADQPNAILESIPFVGVDHAKPGYDVSIGLSGLPKVETSTPPPSDEGADKLLTVTALVPAAQVDAVKGILRRLFAYCADVKISIE